MSWRISRKTCARLAYGIAAFVAAANASAQLIDNPTYVAYTAVSGPALPANLPSTTASSSTPPTGYWQELNGSTLSVSYQRDNTTPSAPHLNITITNTGTAVGNYSLHAGSDRALVVGDVARSKVDLIVAQASQEVVVNAGFYLNDATGNYNGQVETETSLADGFRRTQQTLTAEFVGGTKSWETNEVSTHGHAILSAYNIPPGGTVVLRVKSWNVYNGVTTGNGIMPVLSLGRQQTTGRNKNIKVSVDMIGKSFPGTYASTLELVNNLGYIKQLKKHDDSAEDWSSQSGRITDSFILDLASLNLPAGEYALRYRVATGTSTKGIKLGLASSGVTEVNYLLLNDWRYRIGNILVDTAGGVHVGMAYHHYPGDSDTDFGAPYGTYKFARSMANDDLWQPWWDINPADGSINMSGAGWAKLDAWADKFAPAGQRRLVLTFFGSPPNVTSDPGKVSGAWSVLGVIAPPDPDKLNAFKLAVQASVSRLNGRVFAVECWNEPNSPDMFSGTPTELADICQKVYEGTKAVDPSIPVICPQADSPYTVGYVYGAKTTSGQPITNYCDWVGAHIYNRLGNDEKSKPYAVQSLNKALRLLKVRAQQYGISGKKLAVTEFGVNRCLWNTKPAFGRVAPGQTLDDMSNAAKADAMYHAVMTMHEEGVTALGLYSYDHGDNDSSCRRGGSYIWSTQMSGSTQVINTTVLDAIGNARSEVESTVNATP